MSGVKSVWCKRCGVKKMLVSRLMYGVESLCSNSFLV